MRISDWSSDVFSSCLAGSGRYSQPLQWGAIPVPRQLIGQAQLFVREAAARNRQEEEAGPEGRTQARSARGRQGDEVRRRHARGAAWRRLRAAPCPRHQDPRTPADRKSGASGTSVSGGVDLGGRRIIQKKK